jgi:hypothetical protein
MISQAITCVLFDDDDDDDDVFRLTTEVNCSLFHSASSICLLQMIWRALKLMVHTVSSTPKFNIFNLFSFFNIQKGI